ncbi:MAG: hypothetical protein IT385_25925 [Deltaproteobacteria bacterium]|nr:hypothetical protein [Deltaproteobacteria bacterium]
MGAPRQSWVGIACLVALAAPGARAAIPVPASAVERALDEVARSPTAATSYARLLALLTVMDALPPERRRAWLDRLAALERAPLMAARARFERLALADPPWTAASLTGSAARDGANLGLLTDARVAVGDDAPVMPVLGPRGAIALEPLLHPPSGRDHARVAFGLCAARRVDLVLRLGASGDVIVALDGRALGHADDLSRAAIDQLEVPLALEPGRHELLVVVHGHGREPPVLYARLTDRAGRPAAPEHACAPEAPGPAPDDRGEALPPPAALRALASPWRPLALRLLGHPGHAADLAAAIEGEAHSVARRLGPTFTAIAIDALPTAEARLTLATNLTPAAPLVEAALAADRGQLVRARDRLATVADQPERRLVEARILREAGDPEAALALLSEPADASTTSEARLVERARAALAAGRPDLAD